MWYISSNWKELDGLLATLWHAAQQDDGKPNVAGSTFFYFIDNLVTYYIVSSGC